MARNDAWVEHCRQWSHIPIDDVGYLSSRQMLSFSTGKLDETIRAMTVSRYHGWRNFENKWRDVMGLDSLRGKDIIDFGCGCGLESLELARNGNRLTLTDIVKDNVTLAQRVLAIRGYEAPTDVIRPRYPFLNTCTVGSYDVFYANGVLHHSTWPRAAMKRAHELLRTNGEVRLMVYSDVGWRIATGAEPPTGDPSHDEHYETFVRFFDTVGTVANWYNQEKLAISFGDLFEIERCEYLTPDDRYLGAVLRKR